VRRSIKRAIASKDKRGSRSNHTECQTNIKDKRAIDGSDNSANKSMSVSTPNADNIYNRARGGNLAFHRSSCTRRQSRDIKHENGTDQNIENILQKRCIFARANETQKYILKIALD
jgi:hypothetical protein